MSNLSIFDIAGPVMVGPSSSHTAGACKIGQFARALYHHTPDKVTFYLHGSFGEVYQGHATDRALLAGVMKFRTSDPRLGKAFEIAEERGLKYKFIPKDLGADCHPNTVEIVLESKKYGKMSVIGCSIGGGMIEIVKINGIDVLLKCTAGKCLSLVVCHDPNEGASEAVIDRLNHLPEIHAYALTCSKLGNKIITVVGMEGRRITLPEVEKLEKESPEVEFIRSLSKLQKR